jgi:hypothetical protein
MSPRIYFFSENGVSGGNINMGAITEVYKVSFGVYFVSESQIIPSATATVDHVLN